MKEVSQFSNFLPNFDERIYYRSHGKLESSSASFSVMHVIAHELGHLAEFRAKAREEGSEVRSEDIDIHYEIRNGRLVAVGGTTKVTTAKKANSDEKKDSTSSIQDTVELNFQNQTKEELETKLKQVESDLNLFMVKSLLEEAEDFKDIDSLKEEQKLQGLQRLKSFIKKQLEELDKENSKKS